VPWGFFVMSLFTSLGFCMAGYLAFVERQRRYDRAVPPDADAAADASPRSRPVGPSASSTA